MRMRRPTFETCLLALQPAVLVFALAIAIAASAQVVSVTPAPPAAAINIRYTYQSGAKLGYSVERLADGQLWDFGTSVFTSKAVTATAPLTEDTGIFTGRYKATQLTQVKWQPGEYAITIHDMVATRAVSQLSAWVYEP